MKDVPFLATSGPDLYEGIGENFEAVEWCDHG